MQHYLEGAWLSFRLNVELSEDFLYHTGQLMFEQISIAFVKFKFEFRERLYIDTLDVASVRSAYLFPAISNSKIDTFDEVNSSF